MSKKCVFAAVVASVLFIANLAAGCTDGYINVNHWCSGCGTLVRVQACQGVKGDTCQDAAYWLPCGNNCMVGTAGPCDLPLSKAGLNGSQPAKRCGGSADVRGRTSDMKTPAPASGVF